MKSYSVVSYQLVLLIFLWQLDKSVPARRHSPRSKPPNIPVRYTKSGPVELRVNSSTNTGGKLRLICKARVLQNVNFRWSFNGRVLKPNERIKITFTSKKSVLTVRNIHGVDNGVYMCIATYKDARKELELGIHVKPPPLLKMTPKSELVERGKSMTLRCVNQEPNTTVSNITIFRKHLPVGPWLTVASNTDVFVWTPSEDLSTRSSYDVFDFNCEAKSLRGNVFRSAISRITVIKPGTLSSLGSCPSEMFEGIQWSTTLAGLEDAQPCYNGSGEAKRFCASFPGRLPSWDKANLRHCSSPQFRSIDDEIDALDEGFSVKLNVTGILRELRDLTRVPLGPKPPPGHGRTSRIFGQDLLSTVGVLRRTRQFLEMQGGHPRDLARESFKPFAETASNLLDVGNRVTWEEINEDNPATPAELITALEDFGFGLESNVTGDNLEEAKEQNLIYQVRHIGRQSDVRESGLTFQQEDSLIRLPPSLFASSQEITVVSVMYETLSSILTTLNVSRDLETNSDLNSSATLLLNSKIISSTMKPVGSSDTFKQPVKIVLQHNTTNMNGSFLKRCAYWEPEKEGSMWSNEGCRVVTEESDNYVTTCECDHLTLFAVMVLEGGTTSTSDLATLDTISTVGSAISLAAVTLTILVYIVLWKSLKSPRIVNLLNLCFAIGLLDIFSVIRGPFQNNEGVCRTVGILLHFFLLALFLWMLCEGILLYLMMTDVFKKHYGRKWYIFVATLGWGVPALIVAISVGVVGPSQYGSAGSCWLARQGGFIWAALGPMVVVLLINVVVFGVMLCHVLHSSKVQQEDTTGKLKASLRASVIILPILGFTWTFAILDFFFDEIVLKYLFAIFNSLQGLFIFLFHCVLNRQVQQQLHKTRKQESHGILDRVKTQDMSTWLYSPSITLDNHNDKR